MSARLVLYASVLHAVILGITGEVRGSDTVDTASVRTHVSELIEQSKWGFASLRRVDLDSCIVMLDSAIHLAETNFGSNDTSVATALTWKGYFHAWKVELAESEKHLERAIRIYQAELGPDHPAVARPLWVMGGLYNYTARVSEGYQSGARAVELLDRHPEFDPEVHAWALKDLALWEIRARRDHAAHDRLRTRALGIFQELFGPDDWRVGECLWGMGFWKMDQHPNMLDQACEQIRRGVGIVERALGKGMPRAAIGAEHLAVAYMNQGHFDLAFDVLQSSLLVLEETMGYDHPFTVEQSRRLAELELLRGNFERAVIYAERAAELGQRSRVNVWPDGGFWLMTLAWATAASGLDGQSLTAYRELISSRQEFVDGILRYSSEDLKLGYLQRNPLIDHSFLSLPGDSWTDQAESVALQMLLFGKGVVIDALAAEKSVAYCSDDSALARQVESYSFVCRDIANLTLSGGLGLSSAMLEDSLESMHQFKENLEARISLHCSEFADAMEQKLITVDSVAAALPDNGVLWEFCRHYPLIVKETGGWERREPRYLVFTLDSRGNVERIDLGEAGPIDSLIASLTYSISEAPSQMSIAGEALLEKQLRNITDQLYDRIVAPLEAISEGCDRVYICTDAQLSLLPFEILSSSDSYLIERYRISYVSSGRDLLKWDKAAPVSEGRALILAASDYDADQGVRPSQMFAMLSATEVGTGTRGPSDRTECLAVPFDPLPATMSEGELVGHLLESRSDLTVEKYFGPDASEGTIKYAGDQPRLLHLATHGYFCPLARFSGGSSVAENPMLYSGLALAGANRTIVGEANGDSEDGLLTALEASALNLVGTDLVVLSACRSGLGKVWAAEGVFGLRRAFQHAGAKSVIMSMFDVPDKATVTLMERFYTNWLDGQSKSSALRAAALGVLQERRETHGAAHPLYWGGFILVGDPN